MNSCPSLPLEGWERKDRPAFSGFMHAYNPCIVEVPDREYPFRMWFFGWISDIGNTDYAGRNAFHSGDPSVIYKEGKFYMAYSATSKAFTDPNSDEPIEPPTFSNKAIEGYPSRMIQCIMGATSTDGIHWKKSEKPLLIAAVDNKYPPDPAPGRIGDFHRPCLLWDDTANKWKLYFDYYNARAPGCNTGMAENKGDFITGKFEFAHALEKPLIMDWPNPEVVKIGSCYFAFSDAPGYTDVDAPAGKKMDKGWQSRQLRMAQSNDGLVWEKEYYIKPDSKLGANQVPQTLVCNREGKWWLYLFYGTQVGWRKTNVVYPFFKEGDYNWFYDEIRYMRQEIEVDNKEIQ